MDRTFGSFQRKISARNRTSEKVVLFSRTGCSKRKFVFHFFKAIFDTFFRPSRSFFGKWNWFLLMVNVTQRRTLLVPNFAYHLRKPLTDRCCSVFLFVCLFDCFVLFCFFCLFPLTRPPPPTTSDAMVGQDKKKWYWTGGDGGVGSKKTKTNTWGNGYNTLKKNRRQITSVFVHNLVRFVRC